VDKLWLHALACAHCAKVISKEVSPGDAEKAFLKGLIHDVGATLLLTTGSIKLFAFLPQVLQAGERFGPTPRCKLFDALRSKSLGATANQKTEFDKAEVENSIYEVHTSFGAALLDQWGFSADFVNIAKQHEWAKFAPETMKSVKR